MHARVTAILGLVMATASAIQDPQIARHDAANIRFRGLQALRADSLRAELAAHPRYLETQRGTPEAWLALVRECCANHCRATGHFGADIDVRSDDGQTVVEVAEGLAHRWGHPHIEAGEIVAEDAIRAALDLPVGETVDWRPHVERSLQRAAQRAFVERGLLDAELSLDVAPSDDGLLTLTVRVEKEGPVARIQALEIRGEPSEGVAAVLRQRLAFARDAPFTRDLGHRIRAEIGQLFRYLRVDARPGIRADDGSCILALELVVAPNGLDPAQPTPDEVAVLGRAVRRLAEAARTDLTIGGSLGWIDAVQGDGPRWWDRLSATFHPNAALVVAEKLRVLGEDLGTVTLYTTAETSVLAMPDQGWRTDLGPVARLSFQFSSRLDAKDPTEGETRWGIGIKTRTPDQAPIAFDLQLQEVSLLLARDRGLFSLQPDGARYGFYVGADRLITHVDGATGELEPFEAEFGPEGAEGQLSFGRGASVIETIEALRTDWERAGIESIPPAEAARRMLKGALDDSDAGMLLGALIDVAATASPAQQGQWLGQIRGWVAQVPHRLISMVAGQPSRALHVPFGSWFEVIRRLSRRLESVPNPVAVRPALEDFVDVWLSTEHRALAAWAAAEMLRSWGFGRLSTRIAGHYEGGTHWASVRSDVREALSSGNDLARALARAGAIWKQSPSCARALGNEAQGTDLQAGLCGLGILWDRWLATPLARRLDQLRN